MPSLWGRRNWDAWCWGKCKPSSSDHCACWRQMKLLFLSDQDVRTLLNLDQLPEALAEGFVALSEGRTVAPNRSDVAVPGRGFLLTMPAWQPGNQVAIKMVAVFREVTGVNQAGHPALISLFDQDSGAPVAIMDGR